MTVKRIRLECNGTTVGSHVYDADTGEKLNNTYRIAIDVSREGYAAFVYATDNEPYGATLDGLVLDGPIKARMYPFNAAGFDRMEDDVAAERDTITGWSAKRKPTKDAS